MEKRFTERWFRWLVGAVAFVAMFAMASYQRRTGPTWPIPVEESFAGAAVTGELIRSHAGDGDARLALAVAARDVEAEVLWRRYPTDDDWSRMEMAREEADPASELVAHLPYQPAAAKLEYSMRLRHGGEELVLPHGETAIIRYRDDVPDWVLVLHIVVMFLTLWIVFRAAFGALLGELGVRRFIPWILAFLLCGGFFLGPLVQKYAFDDWWAGWPFGGDWTDNKTLAALVAWLAAWWACRQRPRFQRLAVLLATVVMVIVYLIPHSMGGSELDWSQVEETSR